MKSTLYHNAPSRIDWHTELVHAGKVQLSANRQYSARSFTRMWSLSHSTQAHAQIKTLHTAEITTSCREQQRARESYQIVQMFSPTPWATASSCYGVWLPISVTWRCPLENLVPCGCKYSYFYILMMFAMKKSYVQNHGKIQVL